MTENDPSIGPAKNADRRIREISLHEFTSIPITERPLLVDIRTVDEWDEAHAEGAVHLNGGVQEDRIREIVPDPTTPVVCYCGTGQRAALVAECFLMLGYTHVACLGGGFRAWLLANEPVVYPVYR